MNLTDEELCAADRAFAVYAGDNRINGIRIAPVRDKFIAELAPRAEPVRECDSPNDWPEPGGGTDA